MTQSGTITRLVRLEDTAAALNSNLPAAASTPFVLSIAELAAHEAIASDLVEGEITVGMSATIEHMAPSPVGATLVAVANLVERDGRRLTFDIVVTQGEETVATVSHKRAVVLAAKIAERLAGSA
jgi:fluoroacetyl-CoA thioesterase